MPMRDWKRVAPGIYHAFHHEWVSEISRALNRRLLPPDFYALPEQQTGDFGPDVITLQGHGGRNDSDGGTLKLTKTRPRTQHHAISADAFSLRKQNLIAIRHVTDDDVVAVIGIVSPGN